MLCGKVDCFATQRYAFFALCGLFAAVFVGNSAVVSVIFRKVTKFAIQYKRNLCLEGQRAVFAA